MVFNHKRKAGDRRVSSSERRGFPKDPEKQEVGSRFRYNHRTTCLAGLSVRPGPRGACGKKLFLDGIWFRKGAGFVDKKVLIYGKGG
jgi:hypothetical protein